MWQIISLLKPKASCWRTILLGLFVIFGSTHLLAQNYQVSLLPIALPEQSEFRQILTDNQGYIWFRTDREVYRSDGKNKQLMATGSFEKLLIQRGHVLIVSKDTIYRTFDTLNNRQTKLAALRDLGPSFADHQGEVTIGPDYGIWFADASQLYTVGQKARQFSLPSELHDLPLYQTWYQDNLCLISVTGIAYQFNLQKERFIKVPLFASSNRVENVLIHRDFLLLNSLDGIYGLDLTRPLAELQKLYEPTEITAWTSSGQSNFFISSTDKYSLAEATITHDGLQIREVFQANDPHRIEPLPFKEVAQINYDSATNKLWAMTSAGLATLNKPAFGYVPGIVKNFVSSLTTRENQVYAVAGGTFFNIRSDSYLTPKAFDLKNIPFALAATNDNNHVWYSTAEHRVYQYRDQKNLSVLDFSDRGGIIYYMFGDTNGNVWLSQAPEKHPLPGILKVTPNGESVIYGQPHGLDNRILVTKESPAGTVYCAGIGEETYLYRYDSLREHFVNLSVPLPFDVGESFEVHDIAPASDSILWLATTTGLLKHHQSKIEKIYIKEVPDYEAIAVGVAPDGAIWFSTKSQGLIRYTSQGYTIYDKTAGLPSLKLRYRSLQVDQSGKVWLGTDEGLCVSAQTPPQPLTTRSPIVQGITIAGKTIDQEELSANSLAYRPDFQIQYQSLTHPVEQVRYQHRLLGIDSSWTVFDSNALFHRTDLEEGDYQLEIRALQKGGYTKSTPLVLPFTVSTPWYRSWWAFLIYGLGSSGFVLLIVQMNSVRLRKEKAMIEEEKNQLAERLRKETEDIARQKREFEQLKEKSFVQHWTAENTAKFSTYFSQQNSNSSNLCQLILRQLIECINAHTGIVYTMVSADDQGYLQTVATYAVEDEARARQKFLAGQGMVGTCYESRERKLTTRFPDNFIRISSGLGEAVPGCLLHVPMIFQDHCVGVMELASLDLLREHEIKFVEKVAEMTAARVWAIQAEQENQALLHRMQEQLDELSEQRSELEQRLADQDAKP